MRKTKKELEALIELERLVRIFCYSEIAPGEEEQIKFVLKAQLESLTKIRLENKKTA